jgi:hypothetical protein
MATPGLVTGNVVGGAAYSSPQDQAAAYDLAQRMKRDKENESAQAAAQFNASLQPSAAQRRADADAQMRSAYEKFYGPIMQSAWDRSQGQIGGVSPQRTGIVASQIQPTSSVYAKPDVWGQKTGSMGYQYKPDTNMPAGQYADEMQKAYDMWKAGQLLGAEDWQVKGYLGTSYGGKGAGGNTAGASY